MCLIVPISTYNCQNILSVPLRDLCSCFLLVIYDILGGLLDFFTKMQERKKKKMVDRKGKIRSRNLKVKMANNDLQNTTQEPKD